MSSSVLVVVPDSRLQLAYACYVWRGGLKVGGLGAVYLDRTGMWNNRHCVIFLDKFWTMLLDASGCQGTEGFSEGFGLGVQNFRSFAEHLLLSAGCLKNGLRLQVQVHWVKRSKGGGQAEGLPAVLSRL